MGHGACMGRSLAAARLPPHRRSRKAILLWSGRPGYAGRKVVTNSGAVASTETLLNAIAITYIAMVGREERFAEHRGALAAALNDCLDDLVLYTVRTTGRRSPTSTAGSGASA